MLPFLAPLLGQILGPTLFGSLGLNLAPWMASGLGAGLGSLVATRDPQQALMSGLLTGGLGALSGGLFSHGADAVSAANPTGVGVDAGKAAAMAGNPSIMAPSMPNTMPQLGEILQGKEHMAVNAAPRDSGGGLGSILGWAREHPMMAAGALALPMFMRNEPEYEEPEPTDIPENFPEGPGPGNGYGGPYAPQVPGGMTTEDYLRYGRPSAPTYSGEWQFFPDNELQAPPAAPSSSAAPDDNNEDQERWRRILGSMPGFGFAHGGRIVGPGGPTEDLVQAMGPAGEPIRLSAGEYIMPAAAVQNAGGPDAMDQLRARLLNAR